MCSKARRVSRIKVLRFDWLQIIKSDYHKGPAETWINKKCISLFHSTDWASFDCHFLINQWTSDQLRFILNLICEEEHQEVGLPWLPASGGDPVILVTHVQQSFSPSNDPLCFLPLPHLLLIFPTQLLLTLRRETPPPPPPSLAQIQHTQLWPDVVMYRCTQTELLCYFNILQDKLLALAGSSWQDICVSSRRPKLMQLKHWKCGMQWLKDLFWSFHHSVKLGCIFYESWILLVFKWQLFHARFQLTVIFS